MNAVLSHLKHILDLFSGSCCREQRAQSFHYDENFAFQMRIFRHFKDNLHYKVCVDRPEFCYLFFFLHEQPSPCSQPTNRPPD